MNFTRSRVLVHLVPLLLLWDAPSVSDALDRQRRSKAIEDPDTDAVIAQCQAKKEKIEKKSQHCHCDPVNGTEVDMCDIECAEDAGTVLTCINGTLSGGVCKTKAACPSISSSIENTAQHQCSNYLPCQPCTPNCADGYYYQGEANVCMENSTGWYKRGDCAYLGVHRVGIGVYVLNVGSISLADNSFYADFLLTVLTEDKSFRSYDEAVATFKNVNERECSPKLGGQEVTNHLGSGPNNGYKALSPTQFLRSVDMLSNEGSVGNEDDLEMSFITMDRLTTITRVKYNADTVNWRVSGKAYFKPNLANWPFDKQRLEIMIEDLEETLNTNVSFVMCHMQSYSGLSPNIRFPDHEKQLEFGATSAETCWPPFDHTSVNRTEIYGTLTNPSVRGDITCNVRKGLYASSRYIAYIEYSAPETQRFMKAYLPVCMISYINAMSYILGAEDYGQRITICTGTLTGLVLFHVALDTQLPSSETLTLADHFLIFAYILNFLSWIVTITIMLLHKAQHSRTDIIARVTRWCGPIMTFAVVGALVNFDADDYRSPTTHLIGPIFGALFLGLSAALVEIYFVKRFRNRSRRDRGPDRPDRPRPKHRHPANNIRMRALGVRHRKGLDYSPDNEEAADLMRLNPSDEDEHND